LPEETGARANEIKAAVEQGLDQLLVSARRAAEETQAIDAAFHERVKRNYEMLSEAVQLMGVVAQGGQGASVLARSTPAERARNRVAAAQPHREAGAPALEVPEPPPSEPPAAELPPTEGEPALRGRLKLTPTATDDEFKAVFDAAGGQPPAAEDAGWTWKELLTTLDGDGDAEANAEQGSESTLDTPRLGDELFRDIEAMGVDPMALLTKGRIEEIAAAVQTGDGSGAREVVRTLAPAAIRRISRRLLSDLTFRVRVQALTSRYAELIADAAQRDKQGFQAAALLATNAGRAYLLLDAAAAGQRG
jgi:hypothetical protein